MKATSAIYLKHTNSQGIKSQMHYGFMFPFKSLSTPAVYKIGDEKVSQKRLLSSFSRVGAQQMYCSKLSLGLLSEPGEQVSVCWWGHALSFQSICVPTNMCTNSPNPRLWQDLRTFCQNICQLCAPFFLILQLMHLEVHFSRFTWKVDLGIIWRIEKINFVQNKTVDLLLYKCVRKG